MTLTHDSFTLTRDLAADRARAFAAWADPAQKRRWFVDSDGPGWTTNAYSLDFRVGGMETGSFELPDGPGAGLHENVTLYFDIVPNERIVMAYKMVMNGRIYSASLASVSFADHGGGTRLTYTEQMTMIGESDGVEGRRDGWQHLLDALSRSFESEPE